ncbi:16156_t:CDS:1 [Dentiscutata erythropus]|uniref:16156_t:CDS:1 n=1 Tax=Dentiscutata erythropus TaxID=1348616 RepID=A0A9N9P5D4_9GLOM|nr:16156_t:CDS:1 [Dentiscutata erythropus]
MVKVSKILVYLVLIVHVHLTTSLLTHVFEERNLTTLLANTSGHNLEKRIIFPQFDPLKLKETLIERPAELPDQVELLHLPLACKWLRTFVAFCICCVLSNRNVVFDEQRYIQDPSSIDQLIKARVYGPKLGEMFREYRISHYYNRVYFDGTAKDFVIPICRTSEAIPIKRFTYELQVPCLPKAAEDILRFYDPSTPFSTSDDLIRPPKGKQLLLNAQGFSEFYELMLQDKYNILGYRTQRSLLNIHRQVLKYLSEDISIDNYFNLIYYKFGVKIDILLRKITNLVDHDGLVSQSIADLMVICEEDGYTHTN